MLPVVAQYKGEQPTAPFENRAPKRSCFQTQNFTRSESQTMSTHTHTNSTDQPLQVSQQQGTRTQLPLSKRTSSPFWLIACLDSDSGGPSPTTPCPFATEGALHLPCSARAWTSVFACVDGMQGGQHVCESLRCSGAHNSGDATYIQQEHHGTHWLLCNCWFGR